MITECVGEEGNGVSVTPVEEEGEGILVMFGGETVGETAEHAVSTIKNTKVKLY
jgi:hypothetical protein